MANAGGSRGGGLQTSTADDWAYTLGINVVHAATAVRAALPWLQASGRGAALVIGSISGWKPRAGSAYAVAKAAEIHLAPALAVELAKVALWIESVSPGQPLGFLDANIRCGDALLGMFDLDALEEGVPDAAYKPLTGDDKAAAKYYLQQNKAAK